MRRAVGWPRPPTGGIAGGQVRVPLGRVCDVDTATEQLIASLEALLAAASLEGPSTPVVPLEDWAADQA